MFGQNDGGPAIARRRRWKPFFTEIPVALGGNQTSTIYDAIQEIDFESTHLWENSDLDEIWLLALQNNPIENLFGIILENTDLLASSKASCMIMNFVWEWVEQVGQANPR